MSQSEERPLDPEGLLRSAMEPDHAASGRAAPAIGDLQPHFPDYELLELLGQGGMGFVYKAVQKRLDRIVAIKLLPEPVQADAELGERFRREARTLAALKHGNIVAVYDFGEAVGMHYFVMEYVDGVNLRQVMELGQLSPEEALRITPQVCDALQYAHDNGVVHRDIKPENILIDVHGQVKVADFGLAKLKATEDVPQLTRSTAVVGTPHYMAPEQWRKSAAIDHRADIYALGVMLYEMLTGELPIGDFDAPSKRAGVPKGLDDVVRRALAQQPENRYQHASEVRTDVLSQATAGASRPQPTTPAQAQATRIAPRILLGVIVVLVGLACVVWTKAEIADAKWWEARYEMEVVQYQQQATVAMHLHAEGVEDVVNTHYRRFPLGDPAGSAELQDALQWLALLGGVFTIAALLYGGASGLRQIRNSSGRYRGVGAAVTMIWMVPGGIVFGVAMAVIDAMGVSHDFQAITQLLVGIPLVGLLTWRLVREVKSQRQLVSAGQGGDARGLRVSAGIVMAGAVLAGSIVYLDYDAQAIRQPNGVTTRTYSMGYQYDGPVFSRDFLGQTPEMLMRQLGHPVAIEFEDQGQVWRFQDENGVEDAVFVVRDNRVTDMLRNTPVLPFRGGMPPGWISNSSSSRLRKLEWGIGSMFSAMQRRRGGEPRQVATRDDGATVWRFEDGLTVSVREDRVVQIGP